MLRKDPDRLVWTWGGPDSDWWYFFLGWDKLPDNYYKLCGIMWWWYDGPHVQVVIHGRVVAGWSHYTTTPGDLYFMTEEYADKWRKRPRWLRRLFDIQGE